MAKAKKKPKLVADSVPVRVLPYEDVRRDVALHALPAKVEMSSIDKKGPTYVGYADVSGTLRPYELSGRGFVLQPGATDQDAARSAHQELLDREDTAVNSRRSRGS